MSSAAAARRRAILVEACEPRRHLTAIASGQRVDASIDSPGEVDSYTIDVSGARPTLIVNVADHGGSASPSVSVLKPNGSAATIAARDNGILFVDASGAGGTYTIRVGGGAATGNYRLSTFTPNGTQADDDSDDFSDSRDDVDVDSGRRYALTAGPGDLDVFLVHATRGQAIGATVGRNDEGARVDPVITIVAPDGTIVSRETARADFRAGQTGNYFAIVNDSGNNDEGVYGLSFSRVPGPQYTGDPDTIALASGVTRAGDLPAGDTDVYTIHVDGGVGFTATLDVTSESTSGFVPELALFAPDGSSVASTSLRSGSRLTFGPRATLRVGGTYYLSVRDDDADGGGGVNLRYDLSKGDGLTNAISNGTLRVDGTDADDRVTLVHETVDGIDAVTASVNGHAVTYATRDVTRVDVFAGDGDDSVVASGVATNVYVSGGSGDDTVYGGDGDDTLTGGAGRNRLFGGDGSDRLNGSNGRDFLYGETGDDRLYGQGGNDNLDGGGNKDRLYGGDGDDSLVGGSSNDRMYGEAGDDTLNGGGGNDLLDGGADDDVVLHRESGDELISIERA